MKTRPSGEQQTTVGAKIKGLSAITSAFQSGGQLGGFGAVAAAQAHKASKTAKKRILAKAAVCNKNFVA
jgi:hypothetical protein